ncbi:hypothetical protein [Pseudomonas sp. FEN]|nr:hypothetical protein [Pseudomonas sp. FEN]
MPETRGKYEFFQQAISIECLLIAANSIPLTNLRLRPFQRYHIAFTQ